MKLSRYGGDCYAYCMLAAGHIDLVIETELKPYDILPLIPIIAGAGGDRDVLGRRPPALGGRVDRSGRQARARAGAEAAEGLIANPFNRTAGDRRGYTPRAPA